MSLWIVDTSVVAKWFFIETHSGAALRLVNADCELHAPDTMLLEMDNIVCKRVRYRQISAQIGMEIRDTLRHLPIRRHPFGPLLNSAYDVATTTGKSVYDSLYLALAILLRGRVVTADRRFLRSLADPFARYVSWVEETPERTS